MKRNVKVATALTAGVLVLGGVLAVGPVTAATGGAPAPDRTAAQGLMAGGGQQHAHRQGAGMPDARGDGVCNISVPASQGTLTDVQKTALASMAEDEKLAHDLYTAFADRYDEAVFERIATAETQHLSAVRDLLDRYDITDPTAGRPAGDFADPAVQATYDRLLKQGEGSLDGALKAGRTVETEDIAALDKALSGLTASDVRQLYGNLRAASEKHLAAFDRWIASA
ncbi:DUF2202 domain-containing protein [Streptomyces caeni]|uniref:DUF2202 domain-containing protein n=1 Tax=Streptomyces caeni TaxID=2307231 RepID=A0ABW4IUN5_9ACTN